MSRTPYDGAPYYCAACGLGFAEYMACDQAEDCRLETAASAIARRDASALTRPEPPPAPELALPQAMAIFATRLRSARERAGLTQEQLAERIGGSKSEIGKIERGERCNPTMRTVWRLARAIGASPAYLLGLGRF